MNMHVAFAVLPRAQTVNVDGRRTVERLSSVKHHHTDNYKDTYSTASVIAQPNGGLITPGPSAGEHKLGRGTTWFVCGAPFA